jgi:hypothetical protein
LEEKVHAHNPVEGKAIIHGTDFDGKIVHVECIEGEPLHVLGEHELGATHATNAVYRVIGFVVEPESKHGVRRKDCSR